MPDTIREPAREIPVTHDVDVVIAGGGTAGIAAAVCAARMGLSVVMIERTAQPGGMVTHVTQWLNDFQNKGGFANEFLEHIEEAGDYRRPYYNPYAVVPLFDQMLADAGVRPLYLATVAGPIVEDSLMTGVIVESKSGRHAVRARYVIDASGDGDVAAAAGASFQVGRDSDGACQSISLSHLWLDYRGDALNREDWLKVVSAASRKAGRGFRLEYDQGRLRPMPGGIHAHLNGTPHVTGFDPLDAEGLSDLLIALRRQATEYFHTMRRYAPGFESIACGPFSGIPGIRESRRIDCDDTVTASWARNGHRAENGLFLVSQAIDIHKCVPEEPAIVVEKIPPYHITMGAMLPQGLENIAVAGRCIGGEHESLASYRIIADCFAMGEALAIACRLGIDRDMRLRDLPASDIAAEMQSRGYEQ